MVDVRLFKRTLTADSWPLYLQNRGEIRLEAEASMRINCRLHGRLGERQLWVVICPVGRQSNLLTCLLSFNGGQKAVRLNRIKGSPVVPVRVAADKAIHQIQRGNTACNINPKKLKLNLFLPEFGLQYRGERASATGLGPAAVIPCQFKLLDRYQKQVLSIGSLFLWEMS